MSDFAKLTYQPNELESSEEGEIEERSAAETETETESGSSHTEETESEESGTEEEEELKIRKSPNPPMKLYSSAITGTPGLSLLPTSEEEPSNPLHLTSQKLLQGTKAVAKASEEPPVSEADSITETPTLKDEHSRSARTETWLPKDKILASHELRTQSQSDSAASLKTAVQSERGCRTAKRIMELPVIQSALGVLLSLERTPFGWLARCTRFQCSSSMACLNAVVSPCVNQCAPLVSIIDNMMGACLDVAEKVFPCLQMTPKQMVYASAKCTVDCVCYVPRTVCCLKGPCSRASKEQKQL